MATQSVENALDNIQMSKKILSEIEKTKANDYGTNIDKYARNIVAEKISFNWYYGSYGSSSVYDILHNQFNQQLVNKAISSYLTKNFKDVMKEISNAYLDEARKAKQNLVSQKEIIEKFLEELEQK